MITTTKTTYEVGLLYEKKSYGFYNKEAIVEVQPDISSITLNITILLKN